MPWPTFTDFVAGAAVFPKYQDCCTCADATSTGLDGEDFGACGFIDRSFAPFRCDDGGDKVTASTRHDVILRSARPEGTLACNEEVSSNRLSSICLKAETWDESDSVLQTNTNWGIDVASNAMLAVLPAVTVARLWDSAFCSEPVRSDSGSRVAHDSPEGKTCRTNNMDMCSDGISTGNDSNAFCGTGCLRGVWEPLNTQQSPELVCYAFGELLCNGHMAHETQFRFVDSEDTRGSHYVLRGWRLHTQLHDVAHLLDAALVAFGQCSRTTLGCNTQAGKAFILGEQALATIGDVKAKIQMCKSDPVSQRSLTSASEQLQDDNLRLDCLLCFDPGGSDMGCNLPNGRT